MPKLDLSTTKGRWPSILSSLGVPEKLLSKSNQPCPFCGGKDRFRFSDHEGMGLWYCNKCGPGNGMHFVQRYFDVDFKGAVEKVRGVLGSSTVSAPVDNVKRRARLNQIWCNATPIDGTDLAYKYLLRRGVLTMGPLPADVRFISSLAYYHERKVTGSYPAMVAKVKDASGQPSTLHVTYLNSDGGKADVPSPKKVLSATGSGPHIELYPVDEELAVTEGIETALAVRKRTNIPVWSTLSAGGMRAFRVPAGVTRLWIYGDNDLSYTGQAASYGLAAATRVSQPEVDVRVEIPATPGFDWADIGAWK